MPHRFRSVWKPGAAELQSQRRKTLRRFGVVVLSLGGARAQNPEPKGLRFRPILCKTMLGVRSLFRSGGAKRKMGSASPCDLPLQPPVLYAKGGSHSFAQYLCGQCLKCMAGPDAFACQHALTRLPVMMICAAESATTCFCVDRIAECNTEL